MTTKRGDKTAVVLARLVDEVAELRREGVLRGAMLEEVKGDVGEVKVEVKLTNGRVRGLEKWREHVKGVVTATVIIVGGLGWVLNFFFK